MSNDFFYQMNKKLQQVVEMPKSEHKQLNERANSKSVDEGMFDSLKQGMAKAGKKVARALGGPDDQGQLKDLQRKMGVPQTGKKPVGEEYGPLEEDQLNELSPELLQRYQDQADSQGGKKRMQGSKIADYKLGNRYRLDGDSREAKITARLLAKQAAAKAANPQQTQQPDQSYGRIGADSDRNSIKFGSTYELESAEGGKPMTAKQKKFAKLAPPADKITFADKIAGAKKEVDEMLGDVAADAIKKAVTHKGGEVSKKGGITKHRAAPGVYGGSDADQGHVVDRLKGPKMKRTVADEGSDWSQLGKEYSKPKVGTVTHGAKHDIEQTATGQRVTRRVDPNTGHSVGAEDDKPADGEKRGRGRPKKADKAPERVTAKAYKHKGGRVAKEGEGEDSSELKAAMAMLKKAGYTVSKDGEEELDEKAVSKKQQKFMGMVHATQKGEKAPSKEVAKVAKTMKKKDAEDFASTKHKGLPEKKKKKTEEAGGTGTPTASSGFSFGKGIYDSMNRELENMIAESMSINMSDSTEGGKSLTVTATDDDAMALAAMLQNAGIGGEGAPAEVEIAGTQSPISGDEGACDTCGSHDCGCGDIEEALDENEPDWPTNTETSDDALQYAGGLNKPKTDIAGDGQTTVPVTAVHTQSEDELRRMMEMAGISEQEQVMAPEELEEAKEMCEVCEATPCKCDESVEESLARIRGLAGIQEAAKPDFLDVDKDGDKEESFKKAEKDKEEKKVEESILNMTNLWKAYKG